MDIGTLSLILLCGMLLLLAIGMPLGFASGFLAVVVLFLKFGPDLLLREFGTGPLNILAQRMYGLTTDYVLISVPLFIFMACLLERSGIARDMYSSLNGWLSRTRGGIAIVTAVMAIVMAAMSGIIGGEVVLLGLIALPQMLRLGYNQNLAIGTICASGSLGTMIPPSIVLIIYGLITETSIHALFKAAFLPGFMLAGCYIMYIIIRTNLHPEQAPLPEPADDDLPSMQKAFMFVGLLAMSAGGLALVYLGVQVLQLITDLLFPSSDPDAQLTSVQWRMLMPYVLVPAIFLAALGPKRIARTWEMGKGLIAPLLVVGVVLGSIYGGIAAITEAAAMGTVAVMLLILFRGELTFSLFREALMRTFKSTGTIIWVTFGATALAGAYSIAGGPTYVANMIVGAELPTMGILLIMMVIFLFLGAFMDWVGIVLLVMPVFLPIVLKLPVDEIGLWGTLDPRQVSIWYGILFCVNMQVSFLSPPFGPAAFYLKSVAPPHITLPDIFRGFLPFIGLQLFILMLVLFFPLITTVFL
ncbi:MAG: TRAP transporter large permease subunit [Granulosicoccus sp.]|nr:TRAP transporter large permease subunit [Granulosicoccus sp.]